MKEIVIKQPSEKKGAMDVRIKKSDPFIEIFQESDCILVFPESLPALIEALQKIQEEGV